MQRARQEAIHRTSYIDACCVDDDMSFKQKQAHSRVSLLRSLPDKNFCNAIIWLDCTAFHSFIFIPGKELRRVAGPEAVRLGIPHNQQPGASNLREISPGGTTSDTGALVERLSYTYN